MSRTLLEDLINSLDNRGILIIQAMIGKRCIDLLEAEDKAKKPKPQKSTILLPNKDLS